MESGSNKLNLNRNTAPAFVRIRDAIMIFNVL